MGLIADLRRVRRGVENPAVPLTSNALESLYSGAATAAGRAVSPESSLRQVTVFACQRLIAETVGMLPLILYRRLRPRGKERAREHPVYSMLHDLPNPELTAIELMENLVGHLGMWGNAICEIQFDGAGRRRAVWPLRPDRVTVGITDHNERAYQITLPTGETKILDRWRVWHIRGWGTDAWWGKSPLTVARETIAGAIATEEYGNRFFANDSRPGGVLRHPKQLSDTSAKRLKETWESAHSGLTNAHRVAVLEEGVEWQAIGVPPEDAQFLETMKFREIQVCQIYRVPPHMIGIVDRSTSWGTGLEQQSRGFLTYTALPYMTRISQAAYRDLLTVSERRELFAEFLTDALVQADLQARYQAYNVGRLGGWLSVNDIRERENLNPVEDGDGYLQPLNMAPLGSDGQAQQMDGGDDDAQA